MVAGDGDPPAVPGGTRPVNGLPAGGGNAAHAGGSLTGATGRVHPAAGGGGGRRTGVDVVGCRDRSDERRRGPRRRPPRKAGRGGHRWSCGSVAGTEGVRGSGRWHVGPQRSLGPGADGPARSCVGADGARCHLGVRAHLCVHELRFGCRSEVDAPGVGQIDVFCHHRSPPRHARGRGTARCRRGTPRAAPSSPPHTCCIGENRSPSPSRLIKALSTRLTHAHRCTVGRSGPVQRGDAAWSCGFRTW